MVLKVFRSKKFAKRVLTGLLIIIIPAFVLWGVGNFTKGPQLVGIIDGEKIYPADFARSREGVKAQVLLTYYGNFDAISQILKNRALVNFMAWERLILLNAARDQRLAVTNTDVLSFLTQHPIFQRNGTFDKEVYSYVLRNNFSIIEPRQFEELIRENMQVQALRRQLLKDVSVSDDELLEYYKKANDKVELSYVVIGKDIFLGRDTVSPEEAKNFYQTNRDKFFEPAKVEVEYIELTYADASGKDSAGRTLEKIYPELTASPDEFQQIAEKYDLRYGKTGAFSQNDVIPGVPFFKGFHDAAFTLEEGAISFPLFSAPDEDKGAVYVLRKIKDVPRQSQDFEEVQETIIMTLAEQKRSALSQKEATRLYKNITEDNKTFEETVEASGEKIKTTGATGTTDYIENVGSAGEIVLIARQFEEGAVMPPVAVKKGAFLARVDKIIPADEAEFENQKELLRKELLSRKQMSRLEDWFRENQSQVELRKKLEYL